MSPDLSAVCGSFEPDDAAPGEPTGLSRDSDPTALPDPIRAVAPRTVRVIPDPGDVPIEGYLRDCVNIEPFLWVEEFARLPADFARWNELYAEATDHYLQAKLNADRVTARRSLYIRRNRALFAQTYAITLTEATIANIVAIDPEVMAAEDAAAYADRERTRIRGVLSAIGKKADALVSIGAQLRAEMTTPEHLRAPEGQAMSQATRPKPR